MQLRKRFLGLTLLLGGAAGATCPLPELKETPADCPWAENVRIIDETLNKGGRAEEAMRLTMPSLKISMESDSRETFLKESWGRSINFDEGAKAIIVLPDILDVISQWADVAPRNERLVHAGFEHTYGYVLSNLNTPFGYKRARWVQGDIENGLRFRKRLFHPSPDEGTLFSNVTQLIGPLAYRSESKPFFQQMGEKGRSDYLLKRVKPSLLRIIRVREMADLPAGRTVEIRTDLVKFPHPTGGSNSHLLIYSYADSLEKRPLLITAFPVNEGFVQSVTAPIDPKVTYLVKTRYNAFIPGLTDSPDPIAGRRVVE